MHDELEQHAKTFETSLERERFEVLYPLFKEEVFRRRNLMMAYTAIVSTTLICLLAFIPLFPTPYLEKSSYRWMAITGIVVFTTLFIYVILQHADRHRMAKQQLIRLEQESGLYLSHTSNHTEDSLYPQQWQTDWKSDKSLVIYVSCIGCLMTLVVGMFLL